jgi:hypothetical protein
MPIGQSAANIYMPRNVPPKMQAKAAKDISKGITAGALLLP